MKSKRFTEEQIIGILKQAQGGMKIVDLCRMHNISDATFYTWRTKYGGLEVSEAKRLKELRRKSREDAKRLKELESENRRLKQMLADTMLENRAMKDVLAKKW